MSDELITRNPIADEDARIFMIGQAALSGKKVGVALERKLPGKVGRYMHKIRTRFPSLNVTLAGALTNDIVILTVERETPA